MRERLLRRGMAVSLPAMTGALATEASAAVPQELLLSTTQAALTGSAAASVAALTEGVLRAMFISKLKLCATIFAALALVAGGGLLAWPALNAQDGKGKSDKDLLQGAWRVVSFTHFGKKLDGDEAAKIKMGRFVFEGDKVNSFASCDYKLDSAKTPKEIDITPRQGPENEKDQTFAGIYELKGGELRLSFSPPGQVRPANFENAMTMSFVLKRVKE